MTPRAHRLTLGVAVWIATLGAAGCGYRFTAGGAPLPGGVQQVCAPVFTNHTPEPGLELVFTDAMRERLTQLGVHARASSCDGKLTGEVVNVWGGPTVQSTQGRLASYRIFATVKLRLYKAEALVAETEVTGGEDYLPAIAEAQGDVLHVETNRQAALRRLADTVVKNAYERLATGW